MEVKKMQVVLLIAVLCSCAAAEDDSYNNRPCQPSNHQNAYKKFEAKHVLPKKFRTDSTSVWEKHIRRLNRCNVTIQTFIERSKVNLLKNICNGDGWNWQDNLCTSNSKLPVYVVKVNRANCTILNTPRKTEELVTVACDKVGNHCLPVHFQGQQQTKQRRKVTCSPAAAAAAAAADDDDDDYDDDDDDYDDDDDDDDDWSDEQLNISIRIG